MDESGGQRSLLHLIGLGVRFVLDLNAEVMMPIFMLLFGLLLRRGLAKSLRAALTVGVGFIGIGLVLKLLTGTVGPHAMAFSRAIGLNLSVLDVGWPVGAAVSFASPLALILIPLIFVLNLGLLSVRVTDTMDVDLWNYWHFIYTGALVEALTGSRSLGVSAACLTAVVVLKLADWTAPAVEHHFGLQGVSLPHTETVNWAPVMYALERIEQRIIGFNRLNLSPETIRKRFGLLGEPITMGFALGLLIAVIGQAPTLRTPGSLGPFIRTTLSVGMMMAAVLVLLPKVVALLMEGLVPIAEGARELFQKRFPNRKVYIGLDAATVIAHPSGMAVASILIPVSLALAMVLPGNRMLPFADLAVLAFYIIWAVACSRGNLVRGLVNGTLVVVAILYIGSDLGPLTTQLARNAKFVPAVAQAQSYMEWSGIALGSHVVPWIILGLFDFRSRRFYVALGAAVVYAACWLWVRNDVQRQFAPAPVEEPRRG